MLASVLWGMQYLVPDHYPVWTSFYSEVFGFSALFVLTFSVWISCEKMAISKEILMCAAVLLLMVFLQKLSNVIRFPFQFWLFFVYFDCFLIALIVGFNCKKMFEKFKDEIVFFEICLLISGFLSSVIVLTQWGNIDTSKFPCLFRYKNDAVIGNLAQPNQMAAYLLMVCGLIFIRIKETKFPKVLLACLFVMTLAVGALGSKAALLGIVCQLFYVLWIFRKNETYDRIFVMRWYMPWAFFSIVLPFAMKYARVHWVGMIDGRLNPETIGTRIVIFKQMWAGLMTRPWTGFGALGGLQAQAVGALTVPGGERSYYAHNLIVDMFVDFGIPVGAIFATLFFLWLIKKINNGANFKSMFLVIPLLVYSMTEYPYAYVYFLAPAGVLIGYMEGKKWGVEKDGVVNMGCRWANFPRNFFVFLLMAGVIVAGGVAREYKVVENNYRYVSMARYPGLPNIFRYMDIKYLFLVDYGKYYDIMRKQDDATTRDKGNDICAYSKGFVEMFFVYRCAQFYYMSGNASDGDLEMLRIRNWYGNLNYRLAKKEMTYWLGNNYNSVRAHMPDELPLKNHKSK